MAHTFTNLLTHIIFSTRNRIRVMDEDLRPELFAYLGGIARKLEGKPLIINGTADHVHLLVALPPVVSISEFLRVLKANSSGWVHKKWPSRRTFEWQEGYGAFSVSQSNVSRVMKYIADQEEHHRKVSFQEEFVVYLKRNGIPYDERYIGK